MRSVISCMTVSQVWANEDFTGFCKKEEICLCPRRVAYSNRLVRPSVCQSFTFYYLLVPSCHIECQTCWGCLMHLSGTFVSSLTALFLRCIMCKATFLRWYLASTATKSPLHDKTCLSFHTSAALKIFLNRLDEVSMDDWTTDHVPLFFISHCHHKLNKIKISFW